MTRDLPDIGSSLWAHSFHTPFFSVQAEHFTLFHTMYPISLVMLLNMMFMNFPPFLADSMKLGLPSNSITCTEHLNSYMTYSLWSFTLVIHSQCSTTSHSSIPLLSFDLTFFPRIRRDPPKQPCVEFISSLTQPKEKLVSKAALQQEICRRHWKSVLLWHENHVY